MKKDKLLKIIIIILFIICFIELFYKLGEVPNGLNVDEAGSMYDAISLSKYGVDRYLYHNPVYFINYGGGQNALYTYLAIVFMKIFGVSLWSFRLVAVVFSLISYYLFYKMVNKYDSKLKSVFVLFLLTILPFYVMKSRWGLESYLLNSFLIISLYFFVSAIEKKSNFYYFISGILFGITLYTYAISYLILPIFLGIMIVYLFKKKCINVVNILCLMIPIVILAIPLVLMLMINEGIIKNEVITKYISIPKLWYYRGGEVSILNLKYILYDLDVFFFGDLTSYNTIFKYGTMYYLSFIFIILGLNIMINNMKVKKNSLRLLDVVMIILCCSVIFVSFLIDGVNVNKVNSIYIPFVYFISNFIKYLYDNKYKVMLLFVIFYYCISYGSFIKDYFNNDNGNLFVTDDYFELLDEAEEIYDSSKYSKICNCNVLYIYSLLYDKTNPYTFNNTLITKSDGVSKYVYGYDKYIFGCDEIDDSYIYIAWEDDENIDRLIDSNFKYDKFGNYYLLYS